MPRSQRKGLSPDRAFALFPEMLAGIGIQATKEKLSQFRTHFDLLLRWNARINLTAIRDPEEILRRHFLESAFLTRVVQFGPGTLVDVGSGAGFPGIPVKVLFPETRVVLVEASQKKAAFLKEVARSGNFEGLEILAKRLEELDIIADWVTMRAVKPEPKIIHRLARIVPRGTLALFLGEGDARQVIAESGSTNWRSTLVPWSERRVILVGSAQDAAASSSIGSLRRRRVPLCAT